MAGIGSPRIEAVVAELVCSTDSVDAIRKNTLLTLDVFGANGKLLISSSRRQPPNDNNITRVFELEELDKRGPDIAGCVIFSADNAERMKHDHPIAVFSLIQTGTNDCQVPLKIDLLAKVTFDERIGKSMEVSLGSFDPHPQINGDERGSYEIVAALVHSSVMTKQNATSVDNKNDWLLFPIRKSFPMLPPAIFLQKIEAEVKSLTNGSAATTDVSFSLRSLLNELFENGTPVANDEGQLAETDISSLPRTSIDASRTPKHQEIEQDHQNTSLQLLQSNYAKELQSALDLLKSSSGEFRHVANRVYATPWVKAKKGDASSVCENSEISDSDVVRSDALEKIKRELREEFLEALQGYYKKDEGPPGQNVIYKAHRSVVVLQRDMQKLRQRQSEIEHLLRGLSGCLTLQRQSSRELNLNSVNDKAVAEDEIPLLKTFNNFTLGLEMVVQLIGISFRHLQQSMHYPEAFKDLSTGSTYGCSRKLLEFVTSEKATQLVQDIETLAGIWRVGGTAIESDKFSTGLPDTNFLRKPWWPMRPFDYA